MPISVETGKKLSEFFHAKIDQDVDSDDILDALVRTWGQRIVNCWLQDFAKKEMGRSQRRNRTKKKAMRR